MPDSPDQHLIDALARELGATPSPNGHKVEPSTAPSLLSDGQILELCRKAKNAAKFASLYDDGDIAGYPSPSEADYALLGILKFYTQDPDQLEQLWFGSALGQSNKVRTRADYRRRTINEALEGVTETYQRSNKEELRAGNPQPQVDVPSDSHSLGSTGMRNEEDKNLKRSIQAISFRGREKPGPRAWIVENTIWKATRQCGTERGV
jgi:primase-polymerase (primpol)-like protein